MDWLNQFLTALLRQSDMGPDPNGVNPIDPGVILPKQQQSYDNYAMRKHIGKSQETTNRIQDALRQN